MMYTGRDIQVFVLAHNRGEFLRQTLECYLNQTVGGAEIVILSNAPTEDVLYVAEEYKSRGVKTCNEPRLIGADQNIARAQRLASRAITVIAHDDDYVHPAYLEALLKAYNQIPGLTAALSSAEAWRGEEVQGSCHFKTYVLEGQASLAAYIYAGNNFAFSSCSFKTDFLRRAPHPRSEEFGKIFDVPFMADAAGSGTAAVFKFSFIRYRIHDGQDSRNFASGPSAVEWLRLEAYYKRLLEGVFRLRLLYILQSWHRLRVGWRDWCLCERGRMSFSEYLALAKRMGVYSITGRTAGTLVRGGLRGALSALLLDGRKVILH